MTTELTNQRVEHEKAKEREIFVIEQGDCEYRYIKAIFSIRKEAQKFVDAHAEANKDDDSSDPYEIRVWEMDLVPYLQMRGLSLYNVWQGRDGDVTNMTHGDFEDDDFKAIFPSVYVCNVPCDGTTRLDVDNIVAKDRDEAIAIANAIRLHLLSAGRLPEDIGPFNYWEEEHHEWLDFAEFYCLFEDV